MAAGLVSAVALEPGFAVFDKLRSDAMLL